MSQFPIIEEPEMSRITGGQGVVLLDFWQASRAPCLALEPRLERFASAYPGALKATGSTWTPSRTSLSARAS